MQGKGYGDGRDRKLRKGLLVLFVLEFPLSFEKEKQLFCGEVSVWVSWTKNIFARTESFRDTDVE